MWNEARLFSNKHGIYELPHELPNNLRLRKYQEILKISHNDSLVSSLPSKIKILLKLAKTSWKNRN